MAASKAAGVEVSLDASFSSQDYRDQDYRDQDLMLSALRHAGGRRFWPVDS
ncbi:hypothetical protein [Arthrobacter sp. 7Tela_A1]|uniref:hypothetical protein n=1 Tax=Arthrobacter sp. 7Tela_A1 TaxID=3093745 RepID=UPI003BB652A1